MGPLDILPWALTGSLAIVILSIGIAIGAAIIKATLTAPAKNTLRPVK